MTRAQIRKICRDGAKYFLEDKQLIDDGVCLYFYRKYGRAYMNAFIRLMAPHEQVPGFRVNYWLQKKNENDFAPTCRRRRAMALLLFAEAVDLKELL